MSKATTRPCRVEWVRALLAQCRAAGVACFVKQLGSHPIEAHPEDPGMTRVQCRVRGIRDPKGGDPDEWPDDLKVRQFPNEVRP